MTEQQFRRKCAKCLDDIDDKHSDIKVRVKAYNKALSEMREKHAILMDKDIYTIRELQCRAIAIDVNERKAVYHRNAFDKVFYKYN